MLSSVSTMQVLTSVIAFFAISAKGHMIMKTPVPYDVDQVDNGPLRKGGDNFPCKMLPYTVSTENTMPIGAPQTLSFKGSAVHGGGSCQISLTQDRQPSKTSKWMVIHSIVGGCPATAPANLPDDPNGSGAATFQFSIPQGIAPGKYSLAWTWFNKMGNHEMYMNCAPVTVTGGSSKRDMMSQPISRKRDTPSFPDMFIANIFNEDQCHLDEGFDVRFPVPGNSLETTPGATPHDPNRCFGQFGMGPNGAIGGSFNSSSGSGSGSGSAAGAGPASSAPSATSSAQPASSPASSAPGVFASGAASGVAGSAPSTASAQPSASVVSPSVPASSGSSAGTGGAMSGACSSEGDWYCSADGSSFQRCASGAWSSAQPMASGTKCTPGQSAQLNMEGAGGKARRAHGGHVRRSHHAWGLTS